MEKLLKKPNWRRVREENGWCYDCNNPPVPGKKRCKSHLEANNKGIKARYLVPENRNKKLAYNHKPQTRQSLAAWKRNNRRNKGRFAYVKANAKTRNKEWSLTESIYSKIIALPCYYCGLPNDVVAGVGLDRLDNSKGYVIGNVVSCCIACNYTRRHYFTPDEMKKLGKVIAEIRKERII